MSPFLVLLFTTSTSLYKLPANLLSSLCYVESKYNVSAIHKDDGKTNSVGVCQVKLKTAKWLGFEGTEKELMAPETNVWYAAKYLNYQLNRYHGNVKKAVIAYNKGNAKDLIRTKYSDKVINEWRKNVKCSSKSCAYPH